MLEKRRELAKMAATARAERQRMGFVDADAVTDEELIFQQFINDESDQEDADDDSSDSDNERDARTRARWGNVAHTSRTNHTLMCTRRPSAPCLCNLICWHWRSFMLRSQRDVFSRA